MIIKTIELFQYSTRDIIEVILAHDVEFIWAKGSQSSIDNCVTNNDYTDLIFAAIWSGNA